jgi:type IV secretion system protein VirB9
MEGDSPSWRPVAVFSDGQKTYIRFPEGLGAVDAPPLFIVGAEEENGLVNYRVDRNFYVIDRQISQAILQHGDPRSVISIERVGG